MRNAIAKTIGKLMLAVLMLAMFMQISATAQENIINAEKSDEQTQKDSSDGNEMRLEGVWDLQVTRLNCQTGQVIAIVPAMLTYMRGGTMSDWGTGNAPSLRSPGHGVWNFESGRSYTAAFQFFRFNVDGTLAGKQIVRQQIEMSRFGNTHTNVTTAQVLDVNGNVIANNCSTAIATRFQ